MRDNTKKEYWFSTKGMDLETMVAIGKKIGMVTTFVEADTTYIVRRWTRDANPRWLLGTDVDKPANRGYPLVEIKLEDV